MFNWLKIFDYKIDKYYKMNDSELKMEAIKWNLITLGHASAYNLDHPYFNKSGRINRDAIIKELIFKETANNSKITILISSLALIISIIAIWKSF